MKNIADLIVVAGLLLACGAPAAETGSAPPANRTSAAGEPGWVGYRGNGSGVFPDSRPPVDCDMKSGRNIVWKAPLPNWGHGCPVVVRPSTPSANSGQAGSGQGGRAFVLSEPGWKSDWPVLTCIDTATGKTLWEREVEHLSAASPDKARQAEMAKAWHEYLALYRELYQVFNVHVVQKKAEEGDKKFADLGFTFGGHRGGGYGQLRSLKSSQGKGASFMPASKELTALMARHGLRGEAWHHGCGLGTDCIGQAYATPVSDGKSVFVTTLYTGATCFDLEGKVLWQVCVPDTKNQESYARSPLLYKDMLISDYFGKVIAFDKKTGAIRWSVDTAGGSIATPAVIRVGGSDILLSEGKQDKGGFGVHAVRLSDGKHLPIEGWAIGGTQILADTDRRDVAYFCGRGQHSFWPETEEAVKPPVAVRFALDGEKLKATVLWDGKLFVGAGGFVGMLYHGGKLYCSTGGAAQVIDAASGKLLAGTAGKVSNPAMRPLPATGHLLLLAGDRFYGLSAPNNRTCDGNFKTDAELQCYSLEGKLLGRGKLYAAEVKGEKLEQIRSAVGWDTWPFAYGCPFTIDGNRVYVRGLDELICTGEK